MHFFILKENIIKALTIVGRIVPTRPQLPILSNILFKSENNQIKILATNLELGISFSLGAKIEKEGEMTIPGKLLIEFINSIAADKIEFILEGSNLILKSGKTQASFTTTNPADFPPFPNITGNKKILPFNKIKEAILRMVFAASTDETRPVLTGIKTKISNGKISFASTDGYRLSMEEAIFPDNKEEIEVILPAQSLAELVRIAGELNEETASFTIIEGKNQAIFTLPNVSLFTRIIDGKFPEIEKIIPQSAKTKIIIEKEKFFQSVKTASLFARGAANIVKIKIEKDGLWLSANAPQVGEDKDFVEAKVEGEETEMAFNYRFLLDLLANFPDKEIIFESSGPLAPGVFKPTTKGSSFLHLIMPVRTQG